MSGHSHAKNVKATKDASAKKRSKNFAKVNRLITVAVREGGPNPELNSKLRAAIDKGRDFNMPQSNIEKAIKRANGDLKKEKLEEFTFEAYGPGKVAIMIEGITDNRNRALSEIKQILKKYNGKLVQKGSINWKFERKGLILVKLDQQEKDDFKDKENIELIVIESGAEDMQWKDNNLKIYTNPKKTDEIKKALEEEGIKVKSSELIWKPKNLADVDESKKESCQKLFEDLDDDLNVQEVYSNLE
jgi:YebC/PmpR family DNA-binding regulatory protein